jgi:hypothetical protein
MRFRCSIVLLAVVLCGCESKQTRSTSTVRNPKLDSYFERYCDYTGGLGIGFVASHTYDFEFRQHLKKTEDAELKRLFVLQHLYQELDRAILDFERGIVMTGKSSSRQMTAEERASKRSSITERLDDLSRLDPGDPQREIAEFRDRLSQVENGGSR